MEKLDKIYFKAPIQNINGFDCVDTNKKNIEDLANKINEIVDFINTLPHSTHNEVKEGETIE